TSPAGRSSPSLTETPSTKLQAPEKFQVSNTKHQKQMPGPTARRWFFELGAWCFFGVWNLELVAWALSFSKIEMPQSRARTDIGLVSPRWRLKVGIWPHPPHQQFGRRRSLRAQRSPCWNRVTGSSATNSSGVTSE